MTDPDPWDGLLEEGEEILWQGQPAGRIRIAWTGPLEPIMALFFVGFSIFWMIIASKTGTNFWMFGLLFFAIGLFNLIGVHIWQAYRLRQTFYTLSNRNAFIATNFMGRKTLDHFPIDQMTQIRLDEGKLSNIWFAETTKRFMNNTSQTKPVGFQQLNNGRKVYGLLKSMQKDAT